MNNRAGKHLKRKYLNYEKNKNVNIISTLLKNYIRNYGDIVQNQSRVFVLYFILITSTFNKAKLLKRLRFIESLIHNIKIAHKYDGEN